jgi:dihydroorotase (multifunctional complex type)
MPVDLVLRGTKAYISKEVVDCSIAIDDGKIFKIGKETNMPKAETKIDLKNLLVLPGLIDAHVHLRDEGKAYKEDFYSGTAAAAAGGMTTVLDMPNNDPVTMSAETLRNRMRNAEGKILVNVGFYSEFPQNIGEIERIVGAGAVAFKLFMAEQVGGLEIDDDNALLKAFKVVSRLKALVAAHAEDRSSLKEVEHELKRANRNYIAAFLRVHSEDAEVKAIKRLLKITKQADSKVHLCHVSTRTGLQTIIEEKKSGMSVTCETTPHHLFLSINELEKIGSLAITMPPVREKPHAVALWDGIRRGWIDIVASDHAPHTLEEKKAASVWDVKVGVPGLETTLPLLLTEANRGRLSIGDIVRLMAEKPAEIFRLKGKGCLKEGNSADLTVVDLNEEYRIDASKFYSKAKYSPFDQWKVKGRPAKTFVNGQLIMDDGEVVVKAGSGEVIRRE